jgi:diketogulonate reductase-like aldo/keto reductase
MYCTAWKKASTAEFTTKAIQCGFRAIDTANQLKHYDEALVGQAVKAAFDKGLKRQEFFLQTKFTSMDGQDHRLPYDPKANLATQVKQSIDSSLQHLHTEYVDSYVLHGPFHYAHLTPEDWEVWNAIEEVYESGKAKMIGVSNFAASQLKELLAKAKVKPMVLQNRCYASRGWDREVRTICTDNGIIYQGFSLLTANSREISSATVRDIAQRIGATLPQTIFRFSMQLGMLPLTGTTDPQHMKEDLAAEKYQLTDDDVKRIENLDRE